MKQRIMENIKDIRDYFTQLINVLFKNTNKIVPSGKNISTYYAGIKGIRKAPMIVKYNKYELFSEIWKKHALKDSSGLNDEEVMLHRLNSIKKTLNEMKNEHNVDTPFYPSDYFLTKELPKFNNNKIIVLAALELNKAIISFVSEEIQDLCKGQDPVEALTRAIEIESNYAVLQAELPPVNEVETPTPRKKINKV